MSTLEQAWANTTNRKVNWKGHWVYSLARFEVSEGDVITVTRLSASLERAQALKVSVDRGDLRANGLLSNCVAVWSHTAPKVASIEVVGKKAKTIEVWNAWSVRGVDTSWVGPSGMVIDSKLNTHTLYCSDGIGSPTFKDFVVELAL